MKSLVLLVPCALWTLPFNAVADDAMRCGTYLVKAGDTKVDVLEKCGPPEVERGHFRSG